MTTKSRAFACWLCILATFAGSVLLAVENGTAIQYLAGCIGLETVAYAVGILLFVRTDRRFWIALTLCIVAGGLHMWAAIAGSEWIALHVVSAIVQDGFSMSLCWSLRESSGPQSGKYADHAFGAYALGLVLYLCGVCFTLDFSQPQRLVCGALLIRALFKLRRVG